MPIVFLDGRQETADDLLKVTEQIGEKPGLPVRKGSGFHTVLLRRPEATDPVECCPDSQECLFFQLLTEPLLSSHFSLYLTVTHLHKTEPKLSFLP